MKKRILSILSAFLVFCAVVSSVYAVEVPDLDRVGSISFLMTYKGEAVPGGSLTLYRVARVHVDDGNYSFEYVEDYQDCGVTMDGMLSESMAQALADYTAEADIEGVTQVIDENGQVTFDDLELGLYLLVQQDHADGFSAVKPFLVSVPGKEGESWIYDVNASPKLALEPLPTKPSEPTEPPSTDPTLPQTGQTNWPVPVLATMGLLVFLSGWCLHYSPKKKENK